MLRLQVRGVYDDNINISHTNRIDDYYFAIEPGITIGYGDIVGREAIIFGSITCRAFLFLRIMTKITPSSILFGWRGFHRFSKLALTLSQDVSILDGADVASTTTGTGTIA